MQCYFWIESLHTHLIADRCQKNCSHRTCRINIYNYLVDGKNDTHKFIASVVKERTTLLSVSGSFTINYNDNRRRPTVCTLSPSFHERSLLMGI